MMFITMETGKQGTRNPEGLWVLRRRLARYAKHKRSKLLCIVLKQAVQCLGYPHKSTHMKVAGSLQTAMDVTFAVDLGDTDTTDELDVLLLYVHLSDQVFFSSLKQDTVSKGALSMLVPYWVRL